MARTHAARRFRPTWVVGTTALLLCAGLPRVHLASERPQAVAGSRAGIWSELRSLRLGLRSYPRCQLDTVAERVERLQRPDHGHLSQCVGTYAARFLPVVEPDDQWLGVQWQPVVGDTRAISVGAGERVGQPVAISLGRHDDRDEHDHQFGHAVYDTGPVHRVDHH